MVMEKLSKSTIMDSISKSLDNEMSVDFECLWGRVGKIVHVKIEIKPRDTFVDEHGVRWVRE